MKMESQRLFGSLRQPEYTGENRCVPCTVVNVLIAAVVSGILGVASVSLMVVSFALFLGIIYVRGYLVPGTPTLTRRYFPDRVLRWFDKDPAPAYAIPLDGEDGLDPETVLQGAGALEPCPDADDLCLSTEFREAWYREIDRTDETTAEQTVAEMLGVPASRLSIRREARSYVAYADGEKVGTWVSYEAMVADVAAQHVLRDRIADWGDVPVEERSGVLRGLRVYLDQCPRCDGSVALTTETRESCCRSREYLVSECANCGARLFEMNAAKVE
ncbi:hypothetical protein ACH9L7_05455 [Haloferax sp. S1W]|uniref:hypothetical protein n=1 Tax=Haloferax sp. S1W TaxID=3377110 RepID=UPI0037C7D819